MSALEPLQEAFHALEQDLIHPAGPRISLVHQYPFAILPYPPKLEFEMRVEFSKLRERLEQKDWRVLSLSLIRLLFQRLREQDTRIDVVQKLIEREKRFAQKDIQRGLQDLHQQLACHIEGKDGIAKDCAQAIAQEFHDAPPRSVVFLYRIGALYPFFRTSGLLKHLPESLPKHVPVILLYPGSRRDEGLSFMDRLDPDRDYRPRIYG